MTAVIEEWVKAWPFGHLRLGRSHKGLRFLEFVDGKTADKSKNSSLSPEAQSINKTLDAYLGGDKTDLCRIPIDIEGATPFQQQVWKALQSIPYGETRSYGWVSQAINNPKAMRAVGQANRRNPIPLVVPCHRVVAHDGGLGGFQGTKGLDKKAFLLELEQSAI